MTLVLLTIAWLFLLVLELNLAFKEDKWLGLIIVGVAFILSFVSAAASYHFLTGLADADPIFVESMTFYAFIFANLPTLIYFVIYVIGRFVIRKKHQNLINTMMNI